MTKCWHAMQKGTAILRVGTVASKILGFWKKNYFLEEKMPIGFKSTCANLNLHNLEVFHSYEE